MFYDLGLGGTQASILGGVVVYGVYARSVPEKFSVWSSIHGYLGRDGSLIRETTNAEYKSLKCNHGFIYFLVSKNNLVTQNKAYLGLSKSLLA